MSQKFNVFKADLHDVFVEGNANNLQMARVFILLAIPVMTIFMTALH